MLSCNINHFDKAFKREDEEENRKSGRFPTCSVRSSVGEVLDLSAGGMLLVKRRFKRVPRSKAIAVVIRYEEIKAEVNARLVWKCKRPGVGHLVAMEFIELPDEQREIIKDIVRNSRNWRLFELTDSFAA